jgi:hypothetical protein
LIEQQSMARLEAELAPLRGRRTSPRHRLTSLGGAVETTGSARTLGGPVDAAQAYVESAPLALCPA